MSNKLFSTQRFSLLFKQHVMHNSQFLWLSIGAYVGVIFIVLSVLQIFNPLHRPHSLKEFQLYLAVFFLLFGILYAGHSFPAFRLKESSISYLMLPASALEKFTFEIVSRIGIVLVTLPLLYWITFNVQGYFFTMFTDEIFEPIGIQYLVKFKAPPAQLSLPALYFMLTGGVLLAFSLAFTGAAMFTKQPLVKTLAVLALAAIFFVGYIYIIMVPLGVSKFNPTQTLMLLPMGELRLFTTLAVSFFAGTVVMLFVAFRKLKEREV